MLLANDIHESHVTGRRTPLKLTIRFTVIHLSGGRGHTYAIDPGPVVAS